MNRISQTQTLLFILCATSVIGCQKEAPRTTQQIVVPEATIPFTLTDANNIAITASLNDKHDVEMMFHTAVTSVSLTSETVKRTELELGESAAVTSWGGESTARFGGGNSIRIGELVWDDLTIAEGTLSGPHTGGKFGYNFFKGKIVEFDFESSVLKVYSSLPSHTGYQRFEIEFENDMMFIEGSLKIGSDKLVNRFLIHSGFGGAVLLDDEFVTTSKLLKRLEIIGESQLKDSYGNVLKTKKVTLPTFMIGEYTLTNVPVSVFDGAIGRQKMCVIGGDTLKRFHIILDLQNAHLYLKPNNLFDSKFKT